MRRRRRRRGCTPRSRQPPHPRAALDAWIDEILSFGHHRAKAARVAVLGSPGAMKAEGYAEEMRHAVQAPDGAAGGAARPTGAADGSFPLADPAADAPLIQSVVWAAAGPQPDARQAAVAGRRRHVRCASFCERGAGSDGRSADASGRTGPPRPGQTVACSLSDHMAGSPSSIADHTVEQEQRLEVGHGLADGGPAHVPGDVVPRS